MRGSVKSDGTRFQGSEVVLLGRLLGVVALTGSLMLAACAPGTDSSETPPVDAVVTETSTDSWSPDESTTSAEPTSLGESPTPEPVVGEDDAAWSAVADDACTLATDEYAEWKAQAGDGAAPEALALGAAAAATHAAQTIEALPQPMSSEALGLRDAVLAWAAAYRDLSVAMESGSYSEVTAAGDAAQEAADQIRRLAGARAPSCAVMVDEV